jgi:hypothetical protein
VKLNQTIFPHSYKHHIQFIEILLSNEHRNKKICGIYLRGGNKISGHYGLFNAAGWGTSTKQLESIVLISIQRGGSA